MRRSPKVLTLRHEDGTPYAFSLSADYCAEHEAGIPGIQAVLGSDAGTRLSGIPSRRATRDLTGGITVHEVEVPARIPPGRRGRKPLPPVPCLSVGLSRFNDHGSPAHVLDEASRCLPHEGGISALWDGDGFRILGYDDRARADLRDLNAALAAGDVAIWIGGGDRNPFARGSLVVAMASRIPEEGARIMLEADRDRTRLLDASDATGIAARLDAAAQAALGRSRGFWFGSPFTYYALSPRWADGIDHGKRTAHPVVYWLNPMDQDRVNHGWFTVEELDAWLAGKGPVIKSAKDRKARA